MRFPSRAALLLVAACAATAVPPAAVGQSGRVPQNPGAPGDSTLELNVQEVRLPVTVRDANGRPVGGLTKDDFVVAEDNVRQQIQSFATDEGPLSVMLLLDASTDVYKEVTHEADAELEGPRADASILDRVLGPPPAPDPIRPDPLADLPFARRLATTLVGGLRDGDRVAVMQVADKAELIQDWTGDKAEAEHAIRWRYRVGLKTALWDAVYLAAEEQFAKVEGRRVLVIFGDGVDTASRVTPTQAIAALDRASATVYVVSTARAAIGRAERYLGAEGAVLAPRREQARRAIDALEVADRDTRALAERCGGAQRSAESEADAEAIPAGILDELRRQYLLSYAPKNDRRDGTWRSISVFLARPGLKVQARRGYIAAPDPVVAAAPSP